MDVILCKELKGYKYFKVKNKYDVTLLDGIWLCSCALIYYRDITIECKHIKECKKVL